jgi:ankyrin repeat protein
MALIRTLAIRYVRCIAQCAYKLRQTCNAPQYQDGLTPLLAAASGGFTEVVSFLITQGADINAAEKVS